MGLSMSHEKKERKRKSHTRRLVFYFIFRRLQFAFVFRFRCHFHPKSTIPTNVGYPKFLHFWIDISYLPNLYLLKENVLERKK